MYRQYKRVFYLHGGFERGRVRVVCQALAVALLLHTQQHLDVLAVLIAAGLLVALHPRLDLVLPQRWVLGRLLLWSCTLREKTNTGNLTDLTLAEHSISCRFRIFIFLICTFTLEDFLDPSRKACK